MNDTLIRYLWVYVRPQAGRIIFDLQLFVAIVVAVVISCSERLLSGALQYEIVYQYVSYDLMAFGFTVAALAISFAASTSSFQAKLFQASKSQKKGVGAWEDMIFTISWTGFVHFIAMVSSLLVMAMTYTYGVDRFELRYNISEQRVRAIYGVAMLIQAYAMLQFIYTLISMFMFCHAYVRSQRQEWLKSNGNNVE